MEIKIAVIGLGYVGLPLARLFSTKYPTVGFDMNQHRVDELMQGHDSTLEVSDELLGDAIHNHNFVCSTNLDDIRDCNFYVVAVPTPVDNNNHPDLKSTLGCQRDRGQGYQEGRHRRVRVDRLSWCYRGRVSACSGACKRTEV